MKTKQKVSNLKDKIHKIEKELRSIQDKCNHPTTITKFNNQKNSQNSIRVFCAECDKMVGYPSEQQVKEFLNIGKKK